MNHLKKYIGLSIVIINLLCGCQSEEQVYLESVEEVIATEEVVTETDTQQSGGLCYVYVCGAVVSPGVYQLPEGSRIYEAIELAGGMTEEAAADDVNQAETVTDGLMVKIRTEEELLETDDQVTEISRQQSQDGKVNINTAATEILMTLPGIGQLKAESIVSYREENGDFSSVDAIKNVAGIKDGVYNQIKDKITVD